MRCQKSNYFFQCEIYYILIGTSENLTKHEIPLWRQNNVKELEISFWFSIGYFLLCKNHGLSFLDQLKVRTRSCETKHSTNVAIIFDVIAKYLHFEHRENNVSINAQNCTLHYVKLICTCEINLFIKEIQTSQFE